MNSSLRPMADWGIASGHLVNVLTCEESVDGICEVAEVAHSDMRLLDRVRSRCLGALRRVLGLKGKAVRFAGRPYSYFGYLMKMVRPACSRKGSLAVMRLPYSEL